MNFLIILLQLFPLQPISELPTHKALAEVLIILAKAFPKDPMGPKIDIVIDHLLLSGQKTQPSQENSLLTFLQAEIPKFATLLNPLCGAFPAETNKQQQHPCFFYH